MVHSSLSACGHFWGGPQAVVEALGQWCDGCTLAMPVHAYCYPQADGTVPVFDPAATASQTGAISDAFWRRPDVLRSIHPTHSLAASGPDAQALVENHERCRTPCGAGTPYDKLVQRESCVLMFGVSLISYTLFHTAEDAASVPYLYEPTPYYLRVVLRNGATVDHIMLRQDMRITRRFEEMDKWLESRGLLRRAKLGRGELLFLPRGDEVHRVLLKELRRDPWFLVADSARPTRRQSSVPLD